MDPDVILHCARKLASLFWEVIRRYATKMEHVTLNFSSEEDNWEANEVLKARIKRPRCNLMPIYSRINKPLSWFNNSLVSINKTQLEKNYCNNLSNTSGTGQVGAALKVHKNQVLKYAKILYCDNDIKFAAPETTRMTTHKTKKTTFFPTGNIKKLIFFKIYFTRKKFGKMSQSV